MTSPISSACVILLRRCPPSITDSSKFQILLIQRSKQLKFAGGLWVFPGGAAEACDGSDLLITATRECFEETGILLTSNDTKSKLCDVEKLNYRQQLMHHPSIFNEILSKSQLKLRSASSLPLMWCFVSPVTEKKRFRTNFYITTVEDSDELVVVDDLVDRTNHDQNGRLGGETVSYQWLTPQEALSTRGIDMLPPQFYILKFLHCFHSLDDVIVAANQCISSPVLFHPHFLNTPISSSMNQRVILCLPGDKDYPSAQSVTPQSRSSARLHRITMDPPPRMWKNYRLHVSMDVLRDIYGERIAAQLSSLVSVDNDIDIMAKL